MPKVTIDETEYEIDDMTENGKAQLASLQFVNSEIQRLQAQLAAFQTASNSYSQALREELGIDDD
jgi:hypothetical protein